MECINRLISHIISRVNLNLDPVHMDVEPMVRNTVSIEKMIKYYAYYALSIGHPWYFSFKESNLSGSYFMGRCEVDRSIIHMSDIRGDELKPKGAIVHFGTRKTELYQDETIQIINSCLIRTLVHNNSKNPEIPEYFRIQNTVAMHYSNIHGTTTEGVCLGAFSTADLSVMRNCILGDFAYVQTEDLSRTVIEPGRVWINHGNAFDFDYNYPEGVVQKYVSWTNDGKLSGIFADFLKTRRSDFLPVYDTLAVNIPADVPESAFVSRYCVLKGECVIGKNTLVAQRTYVENTDMGAGSNAQENSFISQCHFAGLDIVAHGGKVVHTSLGEKVFVGFNSFLNGKKEKEITVGSGSIIMPHTIIDAKEPITIGNQTIVWGHVTCQEDLAFHSMSLSEFSDKKSFCIGNLSFKGSGAAFIEAFQQRIEHILEENGARFDGSEETKGHAQKTQRVSFNLFQPYLGGDEEGMFPGIVVGDN
jgi:carbonic anhydrase/acetyltransferase-like protein (isoleucine patch superfamily)